MAFASANLQHTTLGNLQVTYGTWSGSAGDNTGTITVAGGQVWLASITSQDSTGTPKQIPVTISTSGTAGIITITVHNDSAVTAGRFLIVHS